MHFFNLNSDELGAPPELFSGLELSLSGNLMALTGPNGGGKSTLLRILYQRCLEAGVDVTYGVQHPDPVPLSQGQGQSLRWLEWMDRGVQADSVLLLDEPFRHLDADFRFKALKFLKEFPGFKLIVSHDMDFLYEVDEILHLQEGTLLRYGGNYAHYLNVRRQHAEAREKRIANLNSTLHRAEKAGREIQHRQAHRTRKAQRDNLTQNIPRSLINRQKNRAEKTEARLNKQSHTKQMRNQEIRDGASKELRSLNDSTGGIVNIPARSSSKDALVLRDFYFLGSGKGSPGIEARAVESVERNTISISIAAGERLWVQGPNGCGKSTFLQTILGRKEASGICRPGGPVFWMPQGLEFFDSENSLEDSFFDLWTMALPLEAVRNDAKARWRTLLGFSGIRGQAIRRPMRTLSGGERMRVLLTIAALAEPALLILDEPEQNLDLHAKENLICSLNAYSGAILFVSHDAGFATSLRPNTVLNLPESEIVPLRDESES